MIAIELRYDMARTRGLLVTAMIDRCWEIHWQSLIGQLPPLVLAAEPPPERLLHFETSQIANSR